MATRLMKEAMAKAEFQEAMAEGILSLPQDMKAVLRISEDPEVDEEGRVLLAGALYHVLSAHNAIPGQTGIMAHVDDVLVIRLALERVEKSSPEAIARHRADTPELFVPADEQLAAARAFLGDLVTVLDKAVDGCPKLNHLGHTPSECLEEEGAYWLYDTVQEALIDLELDEDEVRREVRGIDKILPHLKSRVAAMGG